jgi:hypothetical protein
MKPPQMGRLAMRIEGDMRRAYYALPDTMEGALYLGELHMAAAELPGFRQRFLHLMRDAVTSLIQQRTDITMAWPNAPQAEPDHERKERP